VSDLGVVDPIRMPIQAQAWVDRVRAWPTLAQVFVGLTIADIVSRGLGVIQPAMYLSTQNPLTFLTAFLPHDALILLPALVVLRRRDAESATPWVLRGAVVIALEELLWSPTTSMASDLTATGNPELVFWLTALGAIVRAAGWLLLGVGLMRLNPPAVRAPIAGLANLGMWLVAGSAFFTLIGLVLSAPQIDFDPERSGTIAITNAVAAVAVLGFAYFVRAVLRGLEDPARPLPATRLAASGVLLTALLGLCGSILYAFAVAAFPFATQLLSALALPFSLLGDVAGYVLVVAAFGLGFAAPLRPLAKDWESVSAAPA
jgi:hypothetical protein